MENDVIRRDDFACYPEFLHLFMSPQAHFSDAHLSQGDALSPAVSL